MRTRDDNMLPNAAKLVLTHYRPLKIEQKECCKGKPLTTVFFIEPNALYVWLECECGRCLEAEYA